MSLVGFWTCIEFQNPIEWRCMPYKDRQKRLEYARKWNKENYKKNTESEKRRIVKRRTSLANWMMGLKAGLRCIYCGEKEAACLDFHYASNKRKGYNFGMFRVRGYGKKRILAEMRKCKVVCANCKLKICAGKIWHWWGIVQRQDATLWMSLSRFES